VVPGKIDALRAKWRANLSLPDLIALRDEIDAMLHRIRSERYIHPPVITCRHCGHIGEAMESDVSVRATILSLGRFGIAAAEDVKTLEKRWAAYRKHNALDLHGKLAGPGRTYLRSFRSIAVISVAICPPLYGRRIRLQNY
jgi:hypothetical protein